jgi:hypothetical protein
LGDSVGQKLAGEGPAPLRVKGVAFADTEEAAEIAARQVEQLRRDQFEFLTALDAAAVDAGLGRRLAESPLAAGAIDAAAVFAQRAMPILPPRPLKLPGVNLSL